MKRLLAMVLTCTVLMMCFAGCHSSSKSNPSDQNEAEVPSVSDNDGNIVNDNGITMTEAYATALDRAVMLLVGSNCSFVKGSLVMMEDIIPTQIDKILYIPATFVVEGLGGTITHTENGVTLSVNGKTVTICGGSQDNTVLLNDREIPGYEAGEEFAVSAKPLIDAIGAEALADDELLIIGDGLNETAAAIDTDAQEILMDAIASQLRNRHMTAIGGASTEAATDRYNGKYGKYRRWSIDDRYMPTASKENELAAVTGPLHVENVKISKSTSEEGAHDCSFTVYNYLGYTYGTVEIYDGKGEWQETVVIEPYEGEKASVVSALANLGIVVGNSIQAAASKDIDYLTYRTPVNSTITSVDVTIPRGGYLQLSCNMNHSDYVAAYNAAYVVSNIIMTSSAFEDILSDPTIRKKISEELTDQLYEAVITSPASIELVAAAFRSTLMRDENSAWHFKEEAGKILQVLAKAFTDVNIDVNGLAVGVITSLSDITETVVVTAVSNAVPYVNIALATWRMIAEYSNTVCLYHDLCTTMKMDSIIIEVVGWREAYARFLLENQERDVGLLSYKQGKGRFVLADIDHCGIPELIVFSQADHPNLTRHYGVIYHYEQGEAKVMSIAHGGTDIPYATDNGFYWSKSAEAPILAFYNSDNTRENVHYFQPSYAENIDFVQTHTLGKDTGTGVYWFNAYDATKFEDWDYDYCINYKNRFVSASCYAYVQDAYGFDLTQYHSIESCEFHLITPAVIQEVLGYPEEE